MLPSPENVAAGFITKWATLAVGGAGYLNGKIPSTKVYYDIVAEGVTWPNATIKCREKNTELQSGPICLVRYEVTIEAMVFDTDSGTLTAVIQSGFNANTNNPTITVTNATGVIYVKNTDGKLEVMKEYRQDGNDLKKIVAEYEVLLQANRW